VVLLCQRWCTARESPCLSLCLSGVRAPRAPRRAPCAAIPPGAARCAVALDEKFPGSTMHSVDTDVLICIRSWRKLRAAEERREHLAYSCIRNRKPKASRRTAWTSCWTWSWNRHVTPSLSLPRGHTTRTLWAACLSPTPKCGRGSVRERHRDVIPTRGLCNRALHDGPTSLATDRSRQIARDRSLATDRSRQIARDRSLATVTGV